MARTKKKNLLWREIESEKLSEYTALLTDLQNAGCEFSAFVIDGRRGVRELILSRFPLIPLQICQFHQVAIIRRYLTSRPKLVASQELLRIVRTLKKSTQEDFENALSNWHERWKEFLNERTTDESRRGWHYTHKRLRSAYRSIATNLPWLFTCRQYPELKIPNTTNSCDGYFAHLKQRLGIHRGLRREQRKKMTNYFLESGLS